LPSRRPRLEANQTNRRKTINNIIDNKVDTPGDLGTKVIEMIDTQDKKLAVVISHTILTNRGRGPDVIDPYQIAQTFLRNQRRGFMPPDTEGES
jgi:hypothetical protein